MLLRVHLEAGPTSGHSGTGDVEVGREPSVGLGAAGMLEGLEPSACGRGGSGILSVSLNTCGEVRGGRIQGLCGGAHGWAQRHRASCILLELDLVVVKFYLLITSVLHC